MKKSVITLLLITLTSAFANAADFTNKMDSLGGNQELAKKAKLLDPNNKMRIVQNRTVDRNWRMELGVNYGMVAGGDPYTSTHNYGGNLDVHINPMWSVGARYYKFYNDLTSEGKRVMDDAASQSASDGQIHPALDFPLESALGVISFYPIYGKLNMFDMGVAQFDVYVIGGYGQTKLRSGSSPTWTAGGGVGVWFTQHFSSRIEVRYQNYQDKIYSGARDVNAVVSTLSIGFIL